MGAEIAVGFFFLRKKKTTQKNQQQKKPSDQTLCILKPSSESKQIEGLCTLLTHFKMAFTVLLSLYTFKQNICVSSFLKKAIK